MRITGQPSGTLYPNLAKLEKHGWLILGKENIDPKIEGRPARRFYKISGAAVPAARLQLAALSERYRVAAMRAPAQRRRGRPVITIVVGFVVAALLLALSGLIGDEVRGWLEFVPRDILRLVAMRLPADQRRAIYDEEWLPELIHHLREVEGRPITRLVVGIGYATSLARGAGAWPTRSTASGPKRRKSATSSFTTWVSGWISLTYTRTVRGAADLATSLRAFQLETQWKTHQGIGRVRWKPTASGGRLQLLGEGLPGVGGKASWGPSGCLLSRTATAGPVMPTSTQAPPLLPL